MSEHTKTFKIFKYRCKMTYVGTALTIEWDPHVPDFQRMPRRQVNQFWKKYQASRYSFTQSVANDLNQAIVIVDIDGRGASHPTIVEPIPEAL